MRTEGEESYHGCSTAELEMILGNRISWIRGNIDDLLSIFAQIILLLLVEELAMSREEHHGKNIKVLFLFSGNAAEG